MSVDARIQDFEDHVEGREINTESTLDQYRRWIDRFERWKNGEDPSEEMLREWDSFLADEDMADYPWSNDRGPSPPTSYSHNSRVQALSAAKLWVRHEYDVRIDNEVQNLALGEPDDFDPTILSRSEVNRVIERAPLDCDNPDCKVALKVGYDAIMRGSELAKVKREDVNEDEKTLFVRATKGSNKISVSLESDTWAALMRHIKSHPDRDVLFKNGYDRAWKPASLNQHIRRKHCEAGSHALFRHSGVTNRLRSGEDFGSVFLRARHQNPATTLRYAAVADVDTPDWVG